MTPKFKPGDRVAERPKATAIPNLSREAIEKTAQYRTQRYGVVVDVYVKVSKGRGIRQSNQNYVKVIWDGKQTPSSHAQMRLVHEHEFEDVKNSYLEGLG